MGNFKLKAGLLIGAIGTGASIGFLSGQPGHRKDYAAEGALVAGIGTATVLAMPSVARLGFRLAKKSAKAGVAAVKRATKAHGKVMFRRVRGRIVPIRPPKKTV